MTVPVTKFIRLITLLLAVYNSCSIVEKLIHKSFGSLYYIHVQNSNFTKSTCLSLSTRGCSKFSYLALRLSKVGVQSCQPGGTWRLKRSGYLCLRLDSMFMILLEWSFVPWWVRSRWFNQRQVRWYKARLKGIYLRKLK